MVGIRFHRKIELTGFFLLHRQSFGDDFQSAGGAVIVRIGVVFALRTARPLPRRETPLVALTNDSLGTAFLRTLRIDFLPPAAPLRSQFVDIAATTPLRFGIVETVTTFCQFWGLESSRKSRHREKQQGKNKNPFLHGAKSTFFAARINQK